MGYCSYVALCVSPVGETDLMKEYNSALADLEPEEQESLTSLIMEPDQHLEIEGSVLRIWEARKWYVEEFTSVKFIDTFVDNHFDDTRLLRYGEEYDDIETNGDYLHNPFQIRIERRFKYKGDNAVRGKFTHLILCLSLHGEKRFQEIPSSALANLPESLRQLHEIYVRVTEIRLDDDIIRCMNLTDPQFSEWLCELVSHLQTELAARDYYVIKLHVDPKQRSEEGALFTVPEGASALTSDNQLASRFGWLAS